MTLILVIESLILKKLIFAWHYYPRSIEHCDLVERTLHCAQENSFTISGSYHQSSSIALESSDNLCVLVPS